MGDECDCTRTLRSYLHLALGHGQAVGQPRALRARQVLGLLEGLLQGEDLLAGEGGPRVFPLPVLVQQDGVICKRETVRGLGDNTRCVQGLREPDATLTGGAGEAGVPPVGALHHSGPEDRRPAREVRQGLRVPGHRHRRGPGAEVQSGRRRRAEAAEPGQT